MSHADPKDQFVTGFDDERYVTLRGTKSIPVTQPHSTSSATGSCGRPKAVVHRMHKGRHIVLRHLVARESALRNLLQLLQLLELSIQSLDIAHQLLLLAFPPSGIFSEEHSIDLLRCAYGLILVALLEILHSLTAGGNMCVVVPGCFEKKMHITYLATSPQIQRMKNETVMGFFTISLWGGGGAYTGS